ncbi:MAG TPA: NCS2 family permease [Bryobacteraceae bacterium]|nr:NCS2 family permease [Bryobacteraceae bacterium]
MSNPAAQRASLHSSEPGASPPRRIVARLEHYFEFKKLDTTWKTELLAGFTTFITMAYIVFVNPSILHDAGMPVPAVFAATCLSAAFATILMGVFARYPIALAPGMGLNAYFTYTVVKGMGVPWQTALGAVFLSGVAFLILTVTGIRQWIIAAIPAELYAAVSAGIGLFIAFIGLRNAGIVKADPSTIVSMGNLHDPNVALAIFGILLIAALQAWKVRAAILIGILTTTALGAVAGLVHWQPQAFHWSDLSGTALHLDIRSALGLGLLEIVFVFLFVDLFDNVGTLMAVTKKAGLIEAGNRIPRVNRILLTDATATIGGSLLGTTTVVSYIECAAGVAAGGRTGVTSIVTGLLFIAALFVAPLIGAVPSAATAPALVVVGGLMMSSLSEIAWDDVCTAFPAFLTLITIPLTFSIANGLAWGIISYVLIHLARGRARQVPWAAYLLAALLIIRFIYIGSKT